MGTWRLLSLLSFTDDDTQEKERIRLHYLSNTNKHIRACMCDCKFLFVIRAENVGSLLIYNNALLTERSFESNALAFSFSQALSLSIFQCFAYSFFFLCYDFERHKCSRWYSTLISANFWLFLLRLHLSGTSTIPVWQLQ